VKVFFLLRSKCAPSVNPRIKWLPDDVFLSKVLLALQTKSAKRTHDGEVLSQRQRDKILSSTKEGAFFFSDTTSTLCSQINRLYIIVQSDTASYWV